MKKLSSSQYASWKNLSFAEIFFQHFCQKFLLSVRVREGGEERKGKDVAKPDQPINS
jgi:hypothetical protein